MVDEVDGDRLFELGEVDEVPVVRVPAGAAKTFRAYDQDQVFLLPPSLDDWLPADHTARFISEIVDDSLDLSSIYSSYTNATGAPPFNPRMMLKLLLYAYSTGVTSSREVERRCHVDVAFRWLSANTAPDYRSLAGSVAAISTLSVTCSLRCWCCVPRPGWSSWVASRWMAPSCGPRRHVTMRCV